MGHEEFLKFLETPDFLKQVRKWGKKAGIFDLKEKAALFLEYLEKGTKQPPVWIEEEETESGAHWSQAILSVLTGQLGYTRTEALNAPLTQAFADFYRHGESIGSVRLMTEDEIKDMEAVNGT